MIKRVTARHEAGCGFNIIPNATLPEVGSLGAEWNSYNAVPRSEWLACSQSEGDKSRLHTLGNCVVPVMAQFALSKLLEMVNLASETAK